MTIEDEEAMSGTPEKSLAPLAPIIGRWRTSGTVLDDAGNLTAEISGTDVYDWLPGGHWIAHEADVRMGDQRVLVHEVIGGLHPAGGWQMYAFEATSGPGVMRLSQEGPDLLLLQGDGLRSWFRIRAGAGRMTSRWERLVDARWQRWMDMQFER